MKNNLIWLNEQNLSGIPVLLGGAALTRAYVENDLRGVFDGRVFYAKDAFEGLSVMEGLNSGDIPEPARATKVKAPNALAAEPVQRSEVERGVLVPSPPFWGTKVVKGFSLEQVASWLDERALFAGQWGLKPAIDGPSYEELVETEGRPRLRRLLDEILTSDLADFGVSYGYWRCYSQGNSLVLLAEGSEREAARMHFPRQSTSRRLCVADFFRDQDEARIAGPDIVAMQLVTVGKRLAQAVKQLFHADRYRDYLELNGLCAQLAEALAESWHARIRSELKLAPDGEFADILHHQGYQGSRYSFGYPATPDLGQRRTLADLLDSERIGVTLSAEFQLNPEFSTDAIIVHHPQAKYFNVR
jgi:5-methyltetrahydrofolate--homocysteine methyltransferase